MGERLPWPDEHDLKVRRLLTPTGPCPARKAALVRGVLGRPLRGRRSCKADKILADGRMFAS
eukprot:2649762-Karenia_brevis.AAC.1